VTTKPKKNTLARGGERTPAEKRRARHEAMARRAAVDAAHARTDVCRGPDKLWVVFVEWEECTQVARLPPEIRTEREARAVAAFLESRGPPQRQPAPHVVIQNTAERLVHLAGSASGREADRMRRAARVTHVLWRALAGDDDALDRFVTAASPLLAGAPARFAMNQQDRDAELARAIDVHAVRLADHWERDALIVALAVDIADWSGKPVPEVRAALHGGLPPNANDWPEGTRLLTRVLRLAGVRESKIQRVKARLRKLRQRRQR
jgi:hypothetical protein